MGKEDRRICSGKARLSYTELSDHEDERGHRWYQNTANH